ncbi:Rne/Rng family ribonuclease [Allobranchiibius sp. GilTou73]|uniref:Rne/Rng family ribonuclease n=1 Tax=Allobranchiibius sp. GilTou73 TaxID=2904523 RepID=UPI001F431E21|nr:Rne/Rng family ribonuclease [Allobranchiibius sp. GilTou73]UIJ34403.1 Rne/Rng family ribonuclease [Allobranchiibius sp. GilTou73]
MGPENDQTSTNNTDDTANAPSAPVVPPAFGLLFQAPDTTARAPRIPASPPPEDTSDERSRAPEDNRDRSNVSDGSNSDAEPDAGDGARPRRRGGRGRKSKSEGAPSADTEQGEGTQDEGGRKNPPRTAKKQSGGDDADAGDASVDETGPDEATDSEGRAEGDGRRRTRRRRRSGSGGGDSEDPPGTVTKVREPRAGRDEVTAIKGSTRLEAKKQRRREGREAGRRRTVITEAEFLARRESVDRVMVVRERDGRTQIGVLEDGVLVEHYVSRDSQQSSMAGNIYLGRVQNVLPSMEAAFVDVGRGRNAVLYAGEVNWDAAGLENGQAKRIENALKSGATVLAQVTKDPIGHKGARLTSQISLPGRFLVYVPGHAMTGISRKLPDTERARLKKILKEVVPADAGVIVRTAAEGASEEDLKADVERLQGTWDKIQSDAKTGHAPSLLHGEPDLALRVIRDVFNEDFTKLVISGDRAWDQVQGYLQAVAPDLAGRLEKWTGEQDLFTVHRVDEQLAKAMDRKVWLPSGGSLVIDRTEAMTVVDVNTGKFVGSGGNLEETVTKNNIEAAEEIVRQLRLRDIGGIIVVDFIDMVLESNRDLVVRRLLECLGRDRTKHQVAEVTSLGLVQMTRKRVGSGLIEVFSEECTACGGRGIIVHDHPVDKGGDTSGTTSGSGSSNGNGNNSGNGGRGRRGKNRSEAPAAPPQQPAPTGPSAAQIAAAAHAAALSAGEKAGDAAQESIEAVHDDVRRVEAAAGPAPQAEPAPEQPATVLASEAPAPAVAQPAPVVATAPATAPPARRKRKRVVAPAGPPVAGDAANLEAAITDQ